MNPHLPSISVHVPCHRPRRWHCCLFWLAAAIPVVAGASADPPLPVFTDVTESAGIRFRHSIGDFDLSNIVEGTGPGGVFFDYDKDGDMDIYFVNGCWHRDVNDNQGRSLMGKLHNALYRNNGDGSFTDVTEATGAGDAGYGMSASAADFDGDGDLDLYVLNYGPNVFYVNNGDGTFTDRSFETGLGDPSWSLSAPWLDFDGDGDLDVYVANYLEYDKGEFQRSGAYYQAENYPGPLSYAGQPDRLYRNEGDGIFTDVTEECGLFSPNGRAMSAVAVDIDADGDTDIFVTNDAMPNHCWINDGKGHFTDRALEMGIAFGEGGQGASSMGPTIGDVDRNGRMDILIPDMGYGCLLFQTLPGLFLDITAQSNLALICGQYTGWGGVLFDYDNDGFLDVFIANGNAHHLYTEEDVLARFDGTGKFIDVAKQSGDYFHQKYVGRGAATADYDNDGDIDLLVFNLNDSPRLLRNDGGNRRHWLTVIPRSSEGGPAALGACVIARIGKREMQHPVIAVNGYLAGNDPRAHFGLGDAANVDTLRILWPDGTETTLKDVAADQILEVTYRAEN